MSASHRDRRLEAVILGIAASVFVTLRVVMLLKRQPDIDELFTVWVARKSPQDILRTLLHDNGPPLYYYLLSVLHLLSVTAGRAFSLVCAAGTLAVVALAPESRPQRLAAVSMFAVLPHNVFFAAEARSYALCAFLLAVAATSLARWVRAPARTLLGIAVGGIVLCAYSHYYGWFLMPLPVVIAVFMRRDRLRDAVIATGVAFIVLTPNLAMMWRQPKEGLEWMRIADPFARLAIVAGSLLRIGVSAQHAFANRPLSVATSAASIALLVIALWRTRRSANAAAYFVMIIVAILSAIAVAAAGMTAYFPIRFESILAAPLVLWLAATLDDRLIAVAVAVALLASADLVRAPAPRPTPARAVAQEIARHASRATPVIGSGVVYLELFGVRDDVIPFPRDYEVTPFLHPTPAALQRDTISLDRTRTPFVWGGMAYSAEERALAARFNTRLLFRQGAYDAVLCWNR